MTQDQYGQARGPGYVVRGDAVADDEIEGYPTGEGKPMTRFQKVASALRGDRADQEDAGRDEAVAVTSPDVPVTQAGRGDAADHPATEPDVFGTTTHTGNGATSAPYAEDQAGAVTIADVPAAGTAGRHAAGPAADEMRPGQAPPGGLGDFSDLAYGDLIPDAGQYTARWQQVQFKFVDDPHASVTEAADIVAQVTATMEAAIQERQRAIAERQRAIAEQQRTLRGRWREGTNADTETLRETLRMYKTFLDQLIGAGAS